MDEGTIILAITSILSTIFVTFILTRYFSDKLAPFEKLGKSVDALMTEDNVAMLHGATNSLSEISTFVASGNAIMQDEEAFNGILSEIAKRTSKIIQMSMMGQASGDSRRLAKAETLVNEALVEGIGNLNPMIKIALKATGLDEELRKDPEMFQAIMQVIFDKGLLNMIDPKMLGIGGDMTGQERIQGGGLRF